MPGSRSAFNNLRLVTTSFFIPPPNIKGERVTLPVEEVRHASRVLRKSAGDEIVAVDGMGGWYRIVLDHVDKRSAVGHIIERREGVGEPPYELTLAVAVLKNRSRFDTLLEKSVELGVSVIVPLITARTEKERVREQRSENILTSALKQCGRSRLPEFRDPVTLEDFLKIESEKESPSVKLICHEGVGTEFAISDALTESRGIGRITALVGPEGGFTDDEIVTASTADYRLVSLGKRRLRTETAAISVAAAVMLAYEC